MICILLIKIRETLTSNRLIRHFCRLPRGDSHVSLHRYQSEAHVPFFSLFLILILSNLPEIDPHTSQGLSTGRRGAWPWRCRGHLETRRQDSRWQERRLPRAEKSRREPSRQLLPFMNQHLTRRGELQRRCWSRSLGRRSGHSDRLGSRGTNIISRRAAWRAASIGDEGRRLWGGAHCGRSFKSWGP